jgi:L-alanine-DL-glutamate epimerase-like enolase superfamily enzyme
MEEAAELSPATKIPLAGDESIVTARDAARARETGAFALAGVKLSKVGGIEAGMRIASALPCFVSSALDGPVGIAAAGRLARALDREAGPSEQPRLAHGLATQRLFSSTVASVECELRDGLLHLPPGPGLGIEIDEEALRAHRI